MTSKRTLVQMTTTELRSNQPLRSDRKQRFGFNLAAALMILLLAAGNLMAQGTTSDPDVDVTIGFQGLKINANSGFSVTLNGASVTGSANNCGAYPETNKALTTLKLDQVYELTPSSGLCFIHIHFDVPECYVLYVDGKETTDLLYEYPGPHQVMVRKKCANRSNASGSSPGPQLGSIVWEVGMGVLSDGRSAENISIRERALTAAVYSPAALLYVPPIETNEVDVVREETSGSLRQVKARDSLADVVVVSLDEYDVRFYTIANVGAKDVNTGLYPVMGQPFVTWKIKNPNPGTSDRLQISRIQGASTITSEYIWNSTTGTWSLSTGNGARIETSVDVVDGATGDRTRTTTIKDSVGTVVSKVAETFHLFPWGESIIKTVVDPDGAALTTLYAYFEEPSETNRYSKPQSITNADGSWEKYDYDFLGNGTLVLRPWKDLDLASATETNSRVTRYGYSYYRSDFYDEHQLTTYVNSIEESIEGTVVGYTTLQRTRNDFNGLFAVTETKIVHSSSLDGTVMSSTTYDANLQGADAWLRGRPVIAVYADGRQDTFTYEKGNYVTNADPSLNQFIPSATGEAQRTTVLHSLSNVPDGVANRTTRDVSVTDSFSRPVLREQYVYSGTGYERISWMVSEYDGEGHLTLTRQHDGGLYSATWVDDQKISDVNQEGTETAYTYDALSRVKTTTKKGAPANGSFPAQGDIVTTFNYDAEGRVISQTLSGGGISLTQSTAYDVAGRTISSTNQTGLTTTFAYANGGRTETITRPGGATEITDKFVDGEIKSISGTGVVPRYFDYGVNTADGTTYKQEFISAASSQRWIKTTTDWVGHDVRVERPGISGNIIAHTFGYNDRGQLVSESVVSASAKLQADKLYEYDGFGLQTRVGLDVDGSGNLTAASTDRLADNSVVYEKLGNNWFLTTTTKTYLTNNNATPTTTQIQRQRLHNFPVNGSERTVSELSTTDVAGNQTTVTVTADRAAKKVTTTTNLPSSSTDAVDITYNGLLQTTSPGTPQAATTYTYDAIGRVTIKTDPVTGTSTASYESGTGRLLSVNEGANTITNEYYPSSHPSAGRLKSQTNANGKKAYFNYNLRGQTTRTWGETTYPIEHVFDSYGQRTELRTFRGGSGWTSSSWPTTTGSADVTKWIYDEPSGLLMRKEDAVTRQVVFTYDLFGRRRTRRWARSAVATYSYNEKTGETATIDYSDSTPDVTFVYDRAGRQTNITDAAGTHTLTYDVAGNVLADQVSSGLLDDLKVTVAYDSFLRRSSLQAARNTTTLSSQTYGYDTNSRLSTITSGTQTATFAYYANSGLLNSVTFTGGSSVVRAFDSFGRLSTVTNTPAGGSLGSYVYTYNNLNQRIRTTREDGSYWAYSYNDRGELISAKKYWSDGMLVAGQQTVYDYDNLGNRNTASNGGDASGASLRQSAYASNGLNQYSQRSVPGAVDVVGTASANAAVTVNGQAAYRRGTYFHKAIALDNSAAPLYSQVDVTGVKPNAGANGEDAITQQAGQVYLAKATEPYLYDLDGNLTSDGRWTYAWDAENRLTSMTAIASVPAAARKRLEFVYDWMSRRIQKRVYSWNSASSAYQLQTVSKYLYDGWDLVAELDGSNALVRSFVRSSQGSGEPAGVLMTVESGSTYFAGYDGNSNIVALIKASDGTVQASYEYNGFGETLTAVGSYAVRNPLRFSAAYSDRETGLLYYGYRYYNPQTGRWINRDPSEETGGLNLYAFASNDGVNSTDHLGLWSIEGDWTGGWHKYSGFAIADQDCDSLGHLAFLITGYESDWKRLRRSDKVKKGERVNIAPLLTLLEDRLRNQVVVAAMSFKSDFDNWTDIKPLRSSGVNPFFSSSRFGNADCTQAWLTIYAKAVIEVFGAEQFDKWRFSGLLQFNQHMLIDKPNGGRAGDMWVGDGGYVKNYPGYADATRATSPTHQAGPWIGENIIKVASGRYWGFTDAETYGEKVHPMSTWEKNLQAASAAVGGHSAGEDFPGFTRRITFINTAKFAARAFFERNR